MCERGGSNGGFDAKLADRWVLGDVINDITDDEEGDISTDQTLLWNMRLLLELRDLPRLSEMHS